MVVNELFVIGDTKRLLVQALGHDLEKMGCLVHLIEADKDIVRDAIAQEDSHCLMYMGDEIDLELLTLLKEKVETVGIHLYLVGKPSCLEMAGKVVDKRQVTAFLPLPLQVADLKDAFEKSMDKRKRVLVIDDEPLMLRSIKTWLGDGFQVSLLNSATSAAAFLAKHTVDLILLDYEMPVMTGSQLLEKLRKGATTHDIPVIFLTSKDDKETVMKVMAMKPDGYLLKSGKPEDIRKSVEDFFCGQKSAQRA